jgi:hypothetical protein
VPSCFVTSRKSRSLQEVNAEKLWVTIDCHLLERRPVIKNVHLHAVASGCLYEPCPWPPAKSHNRESSLE